MKLWLISQDENTGWDTYSACVVAARNEEAARAINPDGDWVSHYSAWASSPDNVAVEYLGEAREGTAEGIILDSFKAA